MAYLIILLFYLKYQQKINWYANLTTPQRDESKNHNRENLCNYLQKHRR